MSEPATEVPPQLTFKPSRLLAFGAIFSLVVPFLVILSYFLLFLLLESHGHTMMATFGLVAMFPLILLLAGIAVGIISIVQVKRRESKALFGVALAGICLNTLFLILLVLVPMILPHLIGRHTPRTPQGRLEVAVQKLHAATTDEDRFYALDDAAKESFVVGNIDDAHKYATNLLSMAPAYQNDWNYGNAIQDGNLVLGRIALREGHIEEAKKYLLESGKSRGSPQMDSFGPNMSLAKDLLEKGEKEVVLQYFELCRKFWENDYGQLDIWAAEVKADKIPDFGANLVY